MVDDLRLLNVSFASELIIAFVTIIAIIGGGASLTSYNDFITNI